MITSAHAADYFVSPTGDDATGDGSAILPKRTLTGSAGAIALANANPGHDNIFCAAGDYSPVPEPGTTAITETASILGPSAVRTLDPRSYIPSLASPNRTPTGAGEARFRATAAVPAGIFNIAADDVTIQGLSIETTAVSQPIIQAAGARANLVVSYNIIWRSAVSVPNASALRGVSLFSAVSPLVEYNSIRSIAGARNGSPDDGVVFVDTCENPVIQLNEIRNTGAVDRSTGILVQANPVGSSALIDRNRIWASTGEAIGKYGITAGPTNSGDRITISNNSVEDFEQAGIALQCPRVDVIGNSVSNNGQTANLGRAGIYVRDATCTDLNIRDNSVGAATHSSSTSIAGLRYQAYVATVGAPLTILGTRNNLSENFSINAGQNVGFGIDGAVLASPGCANSFDVRNNWWGTAAGPAKVGSGTLSTATADACTATAPVVGGAGDAAGVSTPVASRPFRFEPWSLFRGVRNVRESTGASTTTIAGLGLASLGNDRYSKHSISVPGTTAPTTVNIWSPSERATAAGVTNVNNAALFLFDPPTSSTGDMTITVEYTDTGLTAAENDTILAPNFPSGADESSMRMAKWNGSSWEFIPSTVDTINNTVTAVVSSLAAAGDIYSAQPSPVPQVTNSPSVTVLAKPGPPVIVDSAVTVTDPNSTNLDYATVTIENLFDGANEVLAASPSGAILAGDISYSAGVLTIDPATDQSAADFQAVLASVTYDNTAATPDTTRRIISFTVTDSDAPGPYTSVESTKQVDIDINLAPTANDDTLNVAETVATPGNFTASDDGTIDFYTITTFPMLGTISGFNASTGDFTYTSNDLPSSTSDSIGFTATDDEGLESAEGTITVNITAINGVPTMNPSSTRNASVSQGGSFTITSAMIQIDDADSTPSQITINIVTPPTEGTLSPASSFTQNQINLSAVSYTNSGGPTTVDSFTFTFTDGTSTSAPFTFTIGGPAAVASWELFQ